MTTITDLPELPFTVHFDHSISVVVSESPTALDARIFNYGDELEVTADIVRLNTGRDGRCGLLDRVREGRDVHLGPWPENLPRLQPGSFEAADAYEAARREAWTIQDEDKREATLARLRVEHAPGPTSRTHMTYGPRV